MSAGWLGGRLLKLGLAPLTCAADAVGVLAVEDGAVLSGVGDVVAHSDQPLEGVEGLGVSSQGWVHGQSGFGSSLSPPWQHG
jgi:hypothetical protein